MLSKETLADAFVSTLKPNIDAGTAAYQGFVAGYEEAQRLLQQTHVSRSPLFGIFSFAGGRYVGYWSSYEAAEQVMHDEYNDDEWYVDELVCQDCG